MAITTTDRPAWARNLLERHLGRVAAGVSGLAMAVATVEASPGPARFVCACTTGLLLLRATGPRVRQRLRCRHACSRSTVGVHDLIELEQVILNMRAEVQERDEAIGRRLDGIAETVAAIAEELR